MRKRVLSLILSWILLLGILPFSTAFAASEYLDYQLDTLQYCNIYHEGTGLVLDARLCAMAATLAIEQDGEKRMSAYRPNGEKWSTVFEDYDYAVVQASSGCNWMRTKSKPSAASLVEYWMETPGFKENVISSLFTHTGVYMHYSSKTKSYYIVQLFTKPNDSQDTSMPKYALALVDANVNIRSGPGTSYDRIGKLAKGDRIYIQSVFEDWVSFLLQDGGIGYAYRDYIDMITNPVTFSPDLPSTDPGSIGSGIATANVNIRQGPSTRYMQLGKLTKGQTVAVWSIQGQWAEITWDGSRKGYVHTNYIKLVDQ